MDAFYLDSSNRWFRFFITIEGNYIQMKLSCKRIQLPSNLKAKLIAKVINLNLKNKATKNMRGKKVKDLKKEARRIKIWQGK